jgi:transcriptional regulator with XRE-family HTH domain
MHSYRFDGPALRAARERAGLTRAQLAAAVQRSPAAVLHYERGSAAPSTVVVLRLAAVLGIEPGDLFAKGVSQ